MEENSGSISDKDIRGSIGHDTFTQSEPTAKPTTAFDDRNAEKREEDYKIEKDTIGSDVFSPKGKITVPSVVKNQGNGSGNSRG
ncbi:hypothetical protein PNOK_0918400 [Pyrrhoderma noxium]|uniref:Uncharacterized protein n=1 Tax=Pyrrhoderma noxium TaxID=2282107 RepID=A0A286U771_9AGAM|nr:hypothetical protein PNOK_0918400 [Pyrrhoderma noxium]